MRSTNTPPCFLGRSVQLIIVIRCIVKQFLLFSITDILNRSQNMLRRLMVRGFSVGSSQSPMRKEKFESATLLQQKRTRNLKTLSRP